MTSLMSQESGVGANLGQPADHLTVAPADRFGEEAAETTSISEQLRPRACTEKVEIRREGGGRRGEPED